MATSILTLAVGAASAIAQNRQNRKIAKQQAEQNAISDATGQINNAVARRRAAKEARIRKARLVSSAANTGASESSGLSGASSALTANLGAAVALQKTQETAAQGLSAASQKIADANSKIASTQAWTSVAQAGIGAYDDWKNSQ